MVWVVARLSDLGFSRNIIVETIVTTTNYDGYPNAAPMGATLDNDHLILNIYNTSTTCRNLKTEKCAAINITNNIEVFYKTTFKETNSEGKLPQDWFLRSKIIHAPRLKFADAVIEVSVIKQQTFGEKTQFTCQIELVDANKVNPQIYCRAFGACIEAFIHATRVKHFITDQNKERQVSDLLVLIENSNNVVKRVTHNSIYSAIMSDLLEQIDSWRSKK